MQTRTDSTLTRDRSTCAPVRVGPRTLRYRDPDAPPPIPLSPALRAELAESAPEHTPAWGPDFSRDAAGRWVTRLACPPGTCFYGTGEVSGPLARNGQRITLWNTDSFGYTRETPSLYQSHPWVLGVREDGSAFGLLVDTTYRTEIALGERTPRPAENNGKPGATRAPGAPGPGEVVVASEGLAPAVYLIEAEGPEGVLEELASLIGTAPLPPLWALGFHQCRYSYESEHEVLGLAEDFRDRWIPCDAIWLDIDYMQEARPFTTDPHRFPDPEKLILNLRTQGFRTVWILDPGIKADPKDETYAAGLKLGAFTRERGGEVFEGDVWPGRCVWPDFTSARVRRWWGELTARFVRCGADGVWNDMNEPSVFDGPGRTMPETNLHDADPDLGGPDTHARYHNVYGMQMARASFEGLLRERPDRRPFVLSRSNFLGGQRYACCWTGDSASTWEHLAWTIPMMLNLGLSGQPFAGCDIGGFAEDADADLFARWMGIGALLPFARAHSDKSTARHEPWSFGPECEHACRVALERRYRLLPYLYTLFRHAERTGVPPMRPLLMADPADPALRDAEDSFLLGPDLLVRARVRPTGPCRAPMPRGLWRRIEPVDHTEVDDEHLPELFVRGGAILPMGPLMQHTGQRRLDPVTLVISLDEAGEARGELFEDDGDGFGYREGDCLHTVYAAKRIDHRVRVWVEAASGNRQRPLRAAEVIVLLDGGRVARATGVGGDAISVLVDAPKAGPIDPEDPAGTPDPLDM
jgi:alpha-glucosidase